MTTITRDAKSWSEERTALASKLAEACPTDLGKAVIVTGSVARGFLVDALQPITVYQDWLRSAGGLVEPEENAEHMSGTHTKSWHDGVFVETLWQPWSALDATLGAVLLAETHDHWMLTEAWRLADAMPVRAHGRLTVWQERLITQSASIWTAPAWWPSSVVTIWPLAERDARLALAQRLTGYLERGLRILFALNRCWEPDYKWLASERRRLAIKPGELMSRVNSVFALESPRESVRTCLALLIDILTLASEEYDVAAPRERLKEALDVGHLPPPRG